MVTITYIEANGRSHVVEAELGLTVMEAATRNAVPGIDADCGGACACATCHIYVDPDWLGATGERTDLEVAMLEFAEGVTAESRLSCRIPVTEALAGLVVRLPVRQG